MRGGKGHTAAARRTGKPMILPFLCLLAAFGAGWWLGRAVGRSEAPATFRGLYDETIAQECMTRGDTIVLVVDLIAEAGPTEFACARAGSLESLTVREKTP